MNIEVVAGAGWARLFARLFGGQNTAIGTARPNPMLERLRLRDLVVVVVCTLATLELSRTLWDSASGDVGGYERYALAFWAGHPALRTLPMEYPPGAVLPFALTLAPIGDPLLAFLLGAAAAFVLGYVLFVRASGRRAANRFAVYALVGAQGTLLDRYDLFPALLTLCALWLAQRHRFLPSYALLAGGVALKLYPAVLIPAVAIVQWRALGESASTSPLSGRLRHVVGGLLVCGLLVGASTVLPMLRSTDGGSALRYALNRPVQVESAQGTLVWFGTFRGIPARLVWNFGSENLIGAIALALPGPAFIVMLVGCAWAYLLLLRGRITVAWAFLALLCIVVITSKVFSAQYFVWLLPFAAETGGYEALWIAVAALTSLDYPLLYPFSFGTPPLADVWLYLSIVAVRNLLLALLTVLLLVRRDLSVAVQPVRIDGEGVQARRDEERRRDSMVGVGPDVARDEGGSGGGEERK